MNTKRNTKGTPFMKLGLFLGLSLAVAQYVFYFGGREVFMNGTFSSTTQFLLIAGLYLGIGYCGRLYPRMRFWQLFISGFIILAVAFFVKALLSMLLYGVLAPELGASYKALLWGNMEKLLNSMKNLPDNDYKTVFDNVVNPVSIALMEVAGLFVYGIFFTLFIATLHNMFRK